MTPQIIVRSDDPDVGPALRSPAMTNDTLLRYLPLAGVGYGALQLAGDLTIGPFPDGHSSTSSLATYYADHHSQVALGGALMSWSVIFLGLFVAALAWRSRSAPAAATVIAVGGAAALAHEEFSASTYSLLGSISTWHNIDPAALQAWHLTGSEFGIAMGQVVFLLGVAAAYVVARAVPAWAAWSALVLAVLHLTPFGFLASMLFLPWAAAAGVHLTIRKPRPAPAEVGEAVVQH